MFNHSQTNTCIRWKQTTQRYGYSSHDKEHNVIQFMQTGVTLAKLWTLLNYWDYCHFIMKCILYYISFIMLYIEDFDMCNYVGFTNQVTYVCSQVWPTGFPNVQPHIQLHTYTKLHLHTCMQIHTCKVAVADCPEVKL